MKVTELFTPLFEQNVAELLDQTATAQRGAPERAMLRLQMYLGGGVYPYVLEHVGDLTHRMSESFDYLGGQHGIVLDKVEKTLRYLESAYGFEKEMNENFVNNYRFQTEREKAPEPTFEEYMAKIKEMSKAYADAHRKVPVFNWVQRLARQAAVELGDWNFNRATLALRKLHQLLQDKQRYQAEVGQVEQVREAHPMQVYGHERRRFEMGECDLYALALHLKFDFKIQGMWKWSITGNQLIHYWAVSPNGRMFDHTGELTPESLRKRWGDGKIEDATSDDIERTYKECLGGVPMDTVNAIAKEFAAKYPDALEQQIQDDRGGLGSAPAGAGNQGVSARGYREAGLPGEPTLPRNRSWLDPDA